MNVTRLTTGRPRPMSALEAMAGGPWLFASVAWLGLGWAGAQVALTRLLAVLYAPGLVVACLWALLGWRVGRTHDAHLATSGAVTSPASPLAS